MILLLLVSLVGYFLFIARICKWPVAVTPLFTVCLIPSLLYVAGIFNVLAISAHLLFYAGIAFFAAYLLLCFKERQIPYTEILNPGLILFVFYFVFLYLACRSSSYCGYDVFSHWGLVTKDLVLSNKLINLDSVVVYKSYPPGIALFHYFVVSITGYSEGMVLFAHNLFLASAFIPLFQRIRWKQFYLLILVFLISYGLFYVFGELQSASLMADNIVGTVFGMSIASYFLFEGNNAGRLLHLIPALFFLPLTKQIAVYLALCTCVIIVLDYFYCFFYSEPAVGKNSPKTQDSEGSVFTRRKFPGIRNVLLIVILSGIVMATPLVSHFTWKDRLNRYKIQEIFSTDFSLEKIKNTFSGNNSTVRDKETLDNFIKALCKEPVVPITGIRILKKDINFSKWISTVSSFLICLIIAMISISLQSTVLNRRRIFLCQSVLIMSFLAYCFIHLLLYLYSFGAYEGPRIASFGRYMGIFFLGWFYVFIGVFLADSKQLNLPYEFIRPVLRILIIVLFLFLYFNLKICFLPKNAYLSARAEVEKSIPVVNKYCPLNSRIYFIWQKDSGFTSWVFRYEICPRKTNCGGWSVGKPYYEGDVWTADCTPGQLLNMFGEYDYVLVAKADEIFWKRYGALFKGVDLAKYFLDVNTQKAKACGDNLMMDGTVKTIEQGPADWIGWTVAEVNDGLTAAAYGYTGSDQPASNNDRGLTLTFNRKVALTNLVHWSYSNLTFNYVIECDTGGAWTNVATVASPRGTPAVISFNADQSKSSTKWRWYISGWNNPGTNFYAHELAAYKSGDYESMQASLEHINSFNSGVLFKVMRSPDGKISLQKIG